jgi:hypothetical protein
MNVLRRPAVVEGVVEGSMGGNEVTRHILRALGVSECR